MTNTNDGELDPKLVDMLDEHFPKGKCRERGEAMVLLADFLRWHQSLLERREVEVEARIDELEKIKPEFEMIPLIRGWSPYPWATMPPEDLEEAKIWQACHSHAAFYFEEKINNRIAELSQRGEADREKE